VKTLVYVNEIKIQRVKVESFYTRALRNEGDSKFYDFFSSFSFKLFFLKIKKSGGRRGAIQ
jgi:hypothetical protein